MRSALIATFALLLLPPVALGAGRSDLTVRSLSNPPASLAAGSSFQVSETVANRGSSRAGRSATAHYLSTRRTLAGSYFRLAKRQRVGALGPGKRARAALSLVAPPGLTGSYYVVACADALSKLREKNERNNCRASRSPIALTGANPNPGPNPGPQEPAPALPANLAPSVDTTDGSVNYNRFAGPPPVQQPVDPGVTVSDPDSPQLAGATVQIVSGNVSTEDALAVDSQNGITGTYNSGTGVLTLTGSASVADYQAALRSVTYGNSSNQPAFAPRFVVFKVTDGRDESPAASRAIVINAPVITQGSTPTTYSLSGPLFVNIDPGLTISDIDDSNLWGAKVRFLGYEPGNDLFSISTPANIDGELDTQTGVVTLAGFGSVTQYRDTLRGLQWGYGGPDPPPARVFEFSAIDGSNVGAPTFRSVEITP